MVLVITHEAGRNFVTSSNALDALGPKNWLSGFCEWLFAQSLSPELTIEDTQADPRQAPLHSSSLTDVLYNIPLDAQASRVLASSKLPS